MRSEREGRNMAGEIGLLPILILVVIGTIVGIVVGVALRQRRDR